MKERPDIPEEQIIEVTNNTKKIDFRKPYRFAGNSLFWNMASWLWMPFALLVAGAGALLLGLRVQGRKNLKKAAKQGCIVVANHCHYFDTVFASALMFPRQLYITVAQRNMEIPFIRIILKLCRAFPIPSNPAGFKLITSPIGKILSRGHSVMFLPEGELVVMSQTIYRFRPGAFYQSYIHQVPVVPIVYVIRKRKTFGFDLGAMSAKITQVVGEPVMPPKLREESVFPKKELDMMAEQVASWMENILEEYHRADAETQTLEMA